MEFTIENASLRVRVSTKGAQITSVVRKCDGVEHIWQADPAVWDYHAPILFPYAGRVKDGKIFAKGQMYENCPQHGFARLMEHKPVFCGENALVMELTENEQTLKLWPYHFRLVSSFTLEGNTLQHRLTVENHDEDVMPFGIGFHPGFSVPFDDSHSVSDYELRFDALESPVCLNTDGGFISGKMYYLEKNIRSIALDESLFANDSHCMTGLQSKTLGLYEKDSGRAVVCRIENFPYVLIWSKPGQPQFVCIEPWNSLPSSADSTADWNEKPAAAILAPGESWSTTLQTSFIR